MLLQKRSFSASARRKGVGSPPPFPVMRAARDFTIHFCRGRAIVIKILICYNITINT